LLAPCQRRCRHAEALAYAAVFRVYLPLAPRWFAAIERHAERCLLFSDAGFSAAAAASEAGFSPPMFSLAKMKRYFVAAGHAGYSALILACAGAPLPRPPVMLDADMMAECLRCFSAASQPGAERRC